MFSFPSGLCEVHEEAEVFECVMFCLQRMCEAEKSSVLTSNLSSMKPLCHRKSVSVGLSKVYSGILHTTGFSVQQTTASHLTPGPPVFTLIGTAADKDISVLQQISCSLASDQTLLLCFCVVSHVARPREQQNQNQSCFAKGNSASPCCKPPFARVLKLCAFSFPSGIPWACAKFTRLRFSISTFAKSPPSNAATADVIASMALRRSKSGVLQASSHRASKLQISVSKQSADVIA